MSKVAPEPERDEDGMRKEYDAAFWEGAAVGKYADRCRDERVFVPLEADVAAEFPDAASVNAALRSLIEQRRSA